MLASWNLGGRGSKIRQTMKAYYVRQRIGSGGSEGKESSSLADKTNPYEVLDRAYAPANLGEVENGAQLVNRINNPQNPICIAMTVEEAGEVVREGPEIRHKDMGRFFSSLAERSLVVLEPYGSDVDRSKRNSEYLPDLALSGKEFPEIEDVSVSPQIFGKTGLISSQEEASMVPFPQNYTDTAACDRYFFGNIEEASRRIAAEKGVTDEEERAAISVGLNKLYTRYPEVALGEIRDVVGKKEGKPAKVVTISPIHHHLDIILDKLRQS